MKKQDGICRAMPWVAGLVAFTAGLLIHLPATLLDAPLLRATGGVARLAEARGTIWSGTGHMELRERNLRSSYALPLTWRFQPLSLLRGQLGFRVELGTESPPVPLTLGWSGLSLSDTRVLLPAAILGLAVPQLSPLELRGDLALHISHVRIAGTQTIGEASLDWRSAGSALTTVYPLGDYQWDIRSDSSGFNVTMRTQKGPLQLEGRGSWSSGSRPVFQGQARAPESLQPRLAPLLRLFAIERGAGNFEIRIQ